MKKTKLLTWFSSAFVLLFGIQSMVMAAVDNPPATLPTAPTREAGSILSIFSGAYTNAVTIKGFSGAGGSQVKSVLGDDMIYIDKGLNAWSYIEFNQALNIDEYQKLHLDVYVVSGAFDLKVSFTVGATTFILSPKLQEGWNSVDINLADYKSLAIPPNFKNVTQIGLINNGGYERTVFVDNIYAYGKSADEPVDPELPANAAPTPTRPADDVASIFSDAYTNLTTITSFSGTAENNGKFLKAYGNDNLIKISNALNFWAQINFEPVNLSNMNKFHMDVFVVRTSGTIELKIKFNEGKEVARTLNPGWNSLDIPMADFKDVAGVTFAAVTKIDMIRSGGYAQNVFIDNIYAYEKTGEPGEPGDPDLPKTQAPLPENRELSSPENTTPIFSDFQYNYNTTFKLDQGDPVAAGTMKVLELPDFKGDSVLRLTNMNWMLIKPLPVDISNRKYLHIDVYYVPKVTGGTTPKLRLGMGTPTKLASHPDPLPLQEGWNSFDIPLTTYSDQGVDLSNILILKIFSHSGYPINKLYFDNIYAYTGEGGFEITSAPEPIMGKNVVKSVFSEKYLNLTNIENGFTEAENQYKKTWLRPIEIFISSVSDYALRMRALDKVSVKALTPLNFSNMDYIHFNIFNAYTEDLPGSLEIGFKSVGSDMEIYTTTDIQLKDSAWSYVNIPITELQQKGLDCSKIEQILFKGSGNIYTDNIYAFKGEYTLGLKEDDKEKIAPVLSSPDDVLPDRNQALIGLNLASACGGTVGGILGTAYYYPTKEDLYYFKSTGARLFRFPFRWERVQHEVNGPLDMEQDVKLMKEVVAEAERIGMYVMLDMHNYCRRDIGGTTQTLGEGTLTKEHFADVWKKLASEFKDFTNIWGYDIMNEPHGLGLGVWKEGAQAAIDAIRAVDTKTPIVVEGESFASASTWPKTGGNLIDLVDPNNNLVFSAHCYFDATKEGHYNKLVYEEEVTDPEVWKTRLAPYVNWLKEKGQKGILGEFGVPRTDARWLNLLDKILEYLTTNGVSGTYWVGGTGYTLDKVSVQPISVTEKGVKYLEERAQMRVLKKYFDTTPTGIDSPKLDKTRESISVYPNPVTDKVFVEFNTEISSVKIFGLMGGAVKSIQEKGTRLEIDLSGLPAGIYVLVAHAENGNVFSKTIIKK